jgi:hypothetical protein
MGFVKQTTGSYGLGLMIIAGILLMAALLALSFPSKSASVAGRSAQPA